jgi:hypothetical protein
VRGRRIEPVVLNAVPPRPGGGENGRRPLPALAAELRSRLARIAADHADPASGLVDYAGLGASAEFAGLVDLARDLTGGRPEDLATAEEQIAFWANLYNALTLHAIVALEIRTGVGEVHEFFLRVRYDVGGDHFALADIEHGVLRKNRLARNLEQPVFAAGDRRLRWCVARFDPRMHFTLTCGARSCPPIRAWDAAHLDAQLHMATAAFVNGDVDVDPEAGTVTLSRIFHWYEEDFGDVMDFVLRYLDAGPARAWLAAHRDRARLIHRSYSWDLNAAPRP